MISELVVDVQPKEVSIAVLEDKSLVELQKEARNVSFAVGDIYLGKVKKLMPAPFWDRSAIALNISVGC